MLRLVVGFKRWLSNLFAFRRSFDFAPRSPPVAAEEIDRDGANGRIKQRAIVDVMLLSPKPNESFLDDILGIGN